MTMKTKRNLQNGKGDFLLFTISLIFIEIALFLLKRSLNETIGSFLIFSLLTGVVLFGLQSVSKNQNLDRKESAVFLIFLTLSLVSVPLPYLLRPLFLAGMMTVCMMSLSAGMMVQIYVILLNSWLSGDSVERIFYYLTAGIIACIFAHSLKNKRTFLFVFLILLSTQYSLYAGMKILTMDTFEIQEILAILLSNLVTGLCMALFLKREKKESSNSLKILLTPDFPLLNYLREFSEEEYRHSEKVGVLSEKMAEKAGADPLLAKAGGLYYKVGRIDGKDYIRHGAELAIKYNFPENLIEILKQHPKNTVSLSLESTIILLADTLISGFEHIHKTHPDLPYDRKKVIEQIFNSRLEKGYLEYSDMTLHTYFELKHYLMEEGFTYDT